MTDAVSTARCRSPWPWLALPSRFVLFAAAQGIFALIIAAAGAPRPWDRSVAWWMFSPVVANAVCFAALIGLFRREGASY